MSGRAVVVGGGVAGIAAALSLRAAGLAVELVEVRPRLGGAAYSFRRDGLLLDNGQHVLLRCCTAYRALLAELGSAGKVRIQSALEVPFLGPGGLKVRLRRRPLPAPFHLLPALLSYRPLAWRERLGALQAAQALGALRPAEAEGEPLLALLERFGQGRRAVRELWEPLLLPLLNVPVEEAPLGLAAFTLQEGFLGRAAGADIGFHEAPLQQIVGEPAEALLRARGVAVRLRTRACALRREGELWLVETEGPAGREVVAGDGVVVALPHRRAATLLEEASVEGRVSDRLGGVVEDLLCLGTSPIVNLHLIFSRPVCDLPFFGALRSPLQYVFDRTTQAGLRSGQYLAVSLSAADREVGMDPAQLREVHLAALGQLLPAVRTTPLDAYFVTKEHAATFRASAGSGALRPPVATGEEGLFLAGAYVRTGWPATLEGAVRAGRAAAAGLLRFLDRAAMRAVESGARTV